MKVGTRLGLGFALVLLFLIAVTGVGIVRMAQIQDRLDHVVSFNNVVTRLVIDMRNNVNERVSSLRTLTLMSDPADMEPEMKRIKELSDKYAAHQKKLEAQFALEATAEEKALMSAIRLCAEPLRLPFAMDSPSIRTSTKIDCGSSSSAVTTHGPSESGRPSSCSTGSPVASRAVQSFTSV